ncbi:16S rRNA (cytidine(1402)-2'-O)-methyltransferase [bacterium]|nr:16S rRNA (cytidine(1402)-2'-O)-methyltransferase [bacterium]
MTARKFRKHTGRTFCPPDSGLNTAEAEKKGRGTLSLVATPIGNLEDITLRALRCLKAADLILAEDTRHTRKLLTHFDIHCPLQSYYQEVEKKKTQEYLQLLLAGKQIALVTDAGTPGVSDPGAYFVQQAKKHNITIEVLPGASAVLTALLGSGLPMDTFVFLGFPETKSGARRRKLERVNYWQETLVFFVSPHRLTTTLQDMLEVFGDRQAVLCREMTKIHEEFITGLFSELIERAQGFTRGEYTLVVAGSDQEAPEVGESIHSELERLQAEGLALNQAIARVARRKGIPRSEVYALAHAIDNKPN